MIRKLILLSVCFVLPLAVYAQDDPELPVPSERVQELAYLVGEWDVEVHTRVGDANEADDEGVWEDTSAQSSIESALNGFAYLETWVGTVQEETVAVRTFIVYRAPSRNWAMVRTDSRPGSILTYAAVLDADTLTADAQGADAPRERIAFTKVSDDAFTVEKFGTRSNGRGTLLVTTMDYTRRDEPAELDYEGLPEPDPATEQFAFYVGNWSIDFQTLTGGTTNEITATAENRAILGGHAYEELWTGAMFNSPTLAYTLIKYDTLKGEWRSVWWDTSHALFTTSDGTCTEDGCIFPGNDLRYFDITEDGFTFTFTYSNPQDWVMHYTRQIN